MFPELVEWVARERQAAFQQAAEQRRLLKLLAAEQINQPNGTARLRCWLGVHLVDWGMKLQGYRLEAPTLYRESEPCNG
ncbi:MAG: hypothetical protein U0350_37035 [Caldilineaceae bacterium]